MSAKSHAERHPASYFIFSRAEDELSPQTRGTGIGIALVKVLATNMHATGHLYNRYPGTEFQLALPTVYEGAKRGGT
jgi:hypothetical protein